jgi:hypothetical protein
LTVKKGKRQKKVVLFEKKNQKTFALYQAYLRAKMNGPRCRWAQSSQKFFVSFFQKRNTSLLRTCCPITYRFAIIPNSCAGQPLGE